MGRRSEILRRATEVFERQGVRQTSIEDIARAVGIKREAIYYYFKGRREILVEIILPQSHMLLLNLRNIVHSNRLFTDKLHDAIQSHLQSFNPSYLEMTVALREDHFFGNDNKFKELRHVWNDYSNIWTQLIEEGQDNGEFRSEPDPKLIAFAILGMCNWLSRWFDPSKKISIEEIIETYFSFALEGLVKRDDHE
ncbi:MAG: TetR/AcrR family transcriptional regulator [Hyphomicrobiales bacterium]|nr:TetR/AcrR family transcriptional regulator [Hyphomicrobiales bacterium]